MPKTLQVRLQRTYPGRVRAGAPLPTRAMSTEEVIENINHFTTVSTRGQVVEAVVFTGVGAASRSDLERLCAHARERCVRRLVLHAGVEDLEQLPAVIPVDRLVLPLQVGEAAATLSLADSALRRAREAGLEVGANTVLSPTALPLLAAVARVVRHTGCQSLTFTYPFPVDGSQSSDVVPPPAAVAALREVVPLLEGDSEKLTLASPVLDSKSQRASNIVVRLALMPSLTCTNPWLRMAVLVSTAMPLRLELGRPVLGSRA
jgi:hypothetical protein